MTGRQNCRRHQSNLKDEEQKASHRPHGEDDQPQEKGCPVGIESATYDGQARYADGGKGQEKSCCRPIQALLYERPCHGYLGPGRHHKDGAEKADAGCDTSLSRPLRAEMRS